MEYALIGLGIALGLAAVVYIVNLLSGNRSLAKQLAKSCKEKSESEAALAALQEWQRRVREQTRRDAEEILKDVIQILGSGEGTPIRGVLNRTVDKLELVMSLAAPKLARWWHPKPGDTRYGRLDARYNWALLPVEVATPTNGHLKEARARTEATLLWIRHSRILSCRGQANLTDSFRRDVQNLRTGASWILQNMNEDHFPIPVGPYADRDLQEILRVCDAIDRHSGRNPSTAEET